MQLKNILTITLGVYCFHFTQRSSKDLHRFGQIHGLSCCHPPATLHQDLGEEGRVDALLHPSPHPIRHSWYGGCTQPTIKAMESLQSPTYHRRGTCLKAACTQKRHPPPLARWYRFQLLRCVLFGTGFGRAPLLK